MILELVDESRLLIILSPEDMEDYQLTFDSLDWQNGHSRSVIKEFLLSLIHISEPTRPY